MELTDSNFLAEHTDLFKRLLEIASGATTDDKHDTPAPILYHYTGKDGLCGILNSGKLWATRLSCLDKAGELKHPVDFCTDYFFNIAQNASIPAVAKFALSALNMSLKGTDIVNALEEQAAACLSTRSNLKSQWWRYAREGEGYAIGFRRSDLQKVLTDRIKDRNSTKETNWLPRRMLYEDGKKTCRLNRLVREIFSSPSFHNPPTQEGKDRFPVLLAYSSAVAAAHFKMYKFHREHEVRLTIANHLELKEAGTKLPFETRQDGDRVIEYLSVDLRDPTNGLMPIEEILIGPKAPPVFARCTAKRALKDYSCDVKIRRIKRSELQQDCSEDDLLSD